mmetsp:Transcript_46713/g.150093  ORF Transcript_46713/g.150093 Transcript_46713/m.150093 type:complete len:201 (+) Transcript_46713:1837-2439(+)
MSWQLSFWAQSMNGVKPSKSRWESKLRSCLPRRATNTTTSHRGTRTREIRSRMTMCCPLPRQARRRCRCGAATARHGTSFEDRRRAPHRPRSPRPYNRRKGSAPNSARARGSGRRAAQGRSGPGAPSTSAGPRARCGRSRRRQTASECPRGTLYTSAPMGRICSAAAAAALYPRRAHARRAQKMPPCARRTHGHQRSINP